jgi:beta-N-acetylhexosaminidase
LATEAGGAARPPLAVVLGCLGERLSEAERRLFAEANPLGLVLFRRNCRARGQLRQLVAEFRTCVGRPDAPVLIDQEGGRVARLSPPEWRAYPAASQIAALPDRLASEAARLDARLIADDLAAVGITVDAAPVLDLPTPEADPVIGDRAWGTDPERVAHLGHAFCHGLFAGSVLPIIKHIPGHGRARVDSHQSCPRVETDLATLARTDFAPFRMMASMPWGLPWGMTAHIVYTAIDDRAPATFSHKVIETVIRGDIGFDGVLVSDDIAMGALEGSFAERTRHSLEAGCDIVLHCTGVLSEMAEIVAAASPLSASAQRRISRAESDRRRDRTPFDRATTTIRFEQLIAAAPGRPDA